MTKYRPVHIPNDLIEDILKMIREHTEFGYRTHSEFVIDASRRRLEELKQLILNSKKT